MISAVQPSSIGYCPLLRRCISALAALLLTTLAGCFVVPPEQRAQGPGAGSAGSTRAGADTAAHGEVGKTPGATRIPGVHDLSRVAGQLSPADLQTELLAFADRFMEAVAESMDRAAAQNSAAKNRARFQGIKVIYVTSAITIATEPDPLRALREFLVFIELARIVWDGREDPTTPPEVVERLSNELLALRSQLISIARLALSDETVETILTLAWEWREDHPERDYVAFVRFSELGNPRAQRRVDREIRAGGLLAPVKETAREIEEIRLMSERAIFLANHMPILIEWQAELYLDQVLATPEIQSLIGDFGDFTDSADRISNELTVLLDQVSSERAAAIDQFARVLAEERSAWVTGLSASLDGSTARFQAGLKESVDSLLPLSGQLSATAADLRRVMELVTAMQGDGDDDSEDGADLQSTLGAMTSLSDSLGSLATALDGLVSTEANAATIARIDGALRGHERRLFLYAAGIVLLITACAVGGVWFLRRGSV